MQMMELVASKADNFALAALALASALGKGDVKVAHGTSTTVCEWHHGGAKFVLDSTEASWCKLAHILGWKHINDVDSKSQVW